MQKVMSLMRDVIGLNNEKLFPHWRFSRIWIEKFRQLLNSGRRGEEILLGARKPVLNRQHCFDGGSNDVATKERARADLLSILTGLAGPSSLARFFERFAVLRFA